MSEFESNIKYLIKLVNAHDNSLKNIQSKLKDLSIIESFKPFDDDNSDNGNNFNKIANALIDNLDKKVNDKIKITEEKMSKIDESNFKMVKDVQNIKNAQDLNNRNIENNKKIIEEIYIKLKDIEKRIFFDTNDISTKNNYNNTENTLNNNNTEAVDIKAEKKVNLSEGNQNLKDKNNNSNTNINNNIKEVINKNIDDKNKEIIKRIIDIEKNFKLLPNQSWIEEIKNDINILKENTIKYALNTDLDITNNKNEEMRKEIKFLKDQYEDITNSNQTSNEDLQSLKRKFELFNNKINEIEEFYETIENKINTNLNNKLLLNENNKKILEAKKFDDFKSQIIKEFTNVNDNFIHLRKLVDDILNTFKNKVSFKDLKALEDEIIIKLEDLRLSSTKKFADRGETIKNIKYLDQQIKNLVHVYIKKFDKNENWLIAKKPMNSNICASCESYIGDLKDNNPYVPWNKYPLRDQGDKIYRLGNGFSKMLQMIVDENDKKNNNNNRNELSDLIKNMKTERSDIDVISGEISPNRTTTTNNWVKSPQKNLPKIKKGLLKAKSGINVTENIYDNNINSKDNNNINNGIGFNSGSSDNIDFDNKNYQAEFYTEEEEFIRSPKITKIKKITKNE